MSEKKTKARKIKPARLTVEPGNMEKSESLRAHVLEAEPGSFEISGLPVSLIQEAQSLSEPEPKAKKSKREEDQREKTSPGELMRFPKAYLANSYSNPKVLEILKKHPDEAGRIERLQDIGDLKPSARDTFDALLKLQYRQRENPHPLASLFDVVGTERLVFIDPRSKTPGERGVRFAYSSAVFNLYELTKARLPEGARVAGKDQMETRQILEELGNRKLPLVVALDGQKGSEQRIVIVRKPWITLDVNLDNAGGKIFRAQIHPALTLNEERYFAQAPENIRQIVGDFSGRRTKAADNLIALLLDKTLNQKGKMNEEDLLRATSPRMMEKRERKKAEAELMEVFESLKTAGLLISADRVAMKTKPGRMMWTWETAETLLPSGGVKDSEETTAKNYGVKRAKLRGKTGKTTG